MAKPTIMQSFRRGDTPLFVCAPTILNSIPSLTGYSAYLTMTTDANPASNSDAFLHTVMIADPTGALINPQTGLSFGPNFSFQFTNTITELLDPTKTYYVDVQINKSPQNTNNFTIYTAQFTPLVDYGRGLS